jgi:glycosyltransferase involved in cell wall biosynthesis
MESYADKDSRIKIFSKKNEGLALTRNYCLDRAAGIYILNVDSDDWIEADCIEKLITVAVERDADIVVFDIFKNYKNKSFIIKEPYPESCVFETFIDYFIFKDGLCSICNKLIRRELYIKNNIRVYEETSYAEDSTTLLRLITKAHTIIHIQIALYHYCCFTLGMSQIMVKNVLEYYNNILNVYNYYIEQNINTDDFPFIRLKIAYILLSYCTLKKAMEMDYNEYISLARLFNTEIKKIAGSEKFRKFNNKYKTFVYLYSVYLKFCSHYMEDDSSYTIINKIIDVVFDFSYFFIKYVLTFLWKKNRK